jgi:16S rRNA (guanine1207-N2)-methyltransferase
MTERARPQGFDFGALRRFPDVEAPNLFASDASDRLILDEAAAALAGLDDGGPAGSDARPVGPDDGGGLAVVGDRYGALTLAAAALHGLRGIRVHQDAMASELALRINARRLLPSDRAHELGPDSSRQHGPETAVFRQLPLGAELLSGARVVLWQLPRSLDELAEVAEQIARFADAGVRVFAGGRLKHMSTSMNGVLEQFFGCVQAGLARQKSRVLTAAQPIRPTGPPRFPVREFNAELGLWLCAHGATFSSTSLDIGTRYLLDFLDQMKPDAGTAVDLGCGSGVIAAALATARPGLLVTATDQSAAAVASAAATAAANGLSGRVTAVRDDAMASFPPASAGLILLNPPFHIGASVHAGAALKLFDAAARVLAPGGELWTVFNRHLDYRAQLERRVGPTTVQGHNPKFTVTVSVRR